MFAVPGAYDRAITVFSPDGRLFQVEYASETVKRGATVLGIASPEGVVLAAEERAGSKLQDLSFMWKIFQIDDHVGTAVAGLSCDAHILVDQARIYAQSNKLMYDEPIDIEILTRRIGEIKQLYTQHAGVRPFGISMLFGGVDKKGSRLFWTDPSGAFFAYRAWAIGAGGDAANEILEAEYRDNLTMDEALLLGMKCMTKVLEGKAEPQKIRVAIIPRETGKFQKMPVDDVDKYLRKLDASRKAPAGMSDKFTTARLAKGQDKFEILVKPEQALDYKMGKQVAVSQILLIDEIFSDSSKGTRASAEKLQKHFGTTDPLRVAEDIMKTGELQLTTDQRRQLVEEKRR